jgi:hypothetical protein
MALRIVARSGIGEYYRDSGFGIRDPAGFGIERDQGFGIRDSG